jgi:hypothetical protein
MSAFKGLEMANVETLTVPHQLYLQNDYVGKNTVSNVIGQTGLSSFASSSGGGTKNGNEVGQVHICLHAIVTRIKSGLCFFNSEINVRILVASGHSEKSREKCGF